MAKKQDSFYFSTLISCMDHACQAAELLSRIMFGFDPKDLEKQLREMHAIEHAADEEKHKLLNVLTKAFITPIEREDIVLLSHNIDEVTDKIEDVLLHIYCNNIQSMQQVPLRMVSLIIHCCKETRCLLEEFADFRHSKKIQEHIIKINVLEEEADQLFIEGMRALHTNCKDPIQIITWREIYTYLEQCVDACEHVADTVESVVMKNT